MILLVTLKKEGLSRGSEYEDRFIDARTFHWQSQNRTTTGSPHGKIINESDPNGEVHLFIRAKKLRGSSAAPFIYFGQPKFVSWHGEKPISVTWALEEEVPSHLRRLFGLE